jgi:hypothetical protein
MTRNPRANGFNYGTGWGSGPKPAIYEQGVALANRLSDQMKEASRAAWEVEHALWYVRIAETDQERASAIAALTTVVERYDLSVVLEFPLSRAV